MSPTPEEIAATAAAAEQKKKDDEAAVAAAKAKEEAAKKDPIEALEEYLATLDEGVRKEIEEHIAGLKSALVKERKLSPEGKAALIELQKLKDADTQRKQAEMTDLQKAEAAKKASDEKATKLEGDLKTERIKNAVLAEASKANFADPQDAYAMIDHSELEISADGKVTGVVDAIKALVKSKPYLVGAEENPRYDINGGDKGKGPKGADVEEIKKKKAHDYQPL